MPYYQVAVRGASGENSVFTYLSKEKLTIGQLVTVPLRKKTELGVVWSQTSHPMFKVLPVGDYSSQILPPALLKLATWVSDFYATPLGTCLQLCTPAVFPGSSKPRATKDSTTSRPAIGHLPLTPDQAKALATIQQAGTGTVLLHGETGSGKTRIYGELAAKTVSNQKSVLILVPEIGMTEQIAADLSHYLSETVHVAHSGLTPAQRQKLWLQVAKEGPSVVIGTRSALFLPFQSLGLIVVDEAHDSAYKHESAPRYQAVRVAGQLGALHSALTILGSATPSVADFYLATAKKAPIIRMVNQASGKARSVSVSIIDKRDRDQLRNSSLLSGQAVKAISQTLANGKQSLLFLNRRGTAKICLCKTCGWTAQCELCDLPLTYHQHRQALLCHSCGTEYPLITACQNCGSVEIAYQSPGVQALATEVAKLFPEAKLARIDSDVKMSDGLGAQYQELYEGKVNILIGTQSIAKGLDLPQLELEVIVDADTSLHMPDYLTGERMFQLLYQVMGRIGRHQKGQLIVQTITPDNPILRAALERDYQLFYDHEIAARQNFGYPPFSHLARIVVEHASEAAGAKEAQKLYNKLAGLPGLILRGPSACFYPRLRNKYRFQVIIMAKQRRLLAGIHPHLSANCSLDIDPVNLL